MFIVFLRHSLVMLLTGQILRVLLAVFNHRKQTFGICFNWCLYLTIGGYGFRSGGNFPAGGVTDALRVPASDYVFKSADRPVGYSKWILCLRFPRPPDPGHQSPDGPHPTWGPRRPWVHSAFSYMLYFAWIILPFQEDFYGNVLNPIKWNTLMRF